MLPPVLNSYTGVLHQKAVGGITWVWFYAVALFIMTWGLAHHRVIHTFYHCYVEKLNRLQLRMITNPSELPEVLQQAMSEVKKGKSAVVDVRLFKVSNQKDY